MPIARIKTSPTHAFFPHFRTLTCAGVDSKAALVLHHHSDGENPPDWCGSGIGGVQVVQGTVWVAWPMLGQSPSPAAATETETWTCIFWQMSGARMLLSASGVGGFFGLRSGLVDVLWLARLQRGGFSFFRDLTCSGE